MRGSCEIRFEYLYRGIKMDPNGLKLTGTALESSWKELKRQLEATEDALDATIDSYESKIANIEQKHKRELAALKNGDQVDMSVPVDPSLDMYIAENLRQAEEIQRLKGRLTVNPIVSSSAGDNSKEQLLILLESKHHEIQELEVRLKTLSDLFEVTRGYKASTTPGDHHLSEADYKTLEKLQVLLQRSEAEMIKRASKNAALQYEVTRLTALLEKQSNGERPMSMRVQGEK